MSGCLVPLFAISIEWESFPHRSRSPVGARSGFERIWTSGWMIKGGDGSQWQYASPDMLRDRSVRHRMTIAASRTQSSVR